MNEDLKWLAKNVHEWPEDKTHAVISEDFKQYAFVTLDDIPARHSGDWYTRTQWQSARDELSGKPSWDCVDSEWIAQDEDGEWYSFDNKPYHGDSCWDVNPCYRESYGYGTVLGDWRNTLERRPDSKPAQSQKQWRGPEDGLPPVGTACICEYYDYCRKTIKATIVAYNNGRVWVDSDCGDSLILVIRETDFKPVPSEEDKAVEEMVGARKAHHWSDEQFCRELYRAGWRKQESE